MKVSENYLEAKANKEILSPADQNYLDYLLKLERLDPDYQGGGLPACQNLWEHYVKSGKQHH